MYSRPDAVYNIQRAALTVAALTSGNSAHLREAMRDRIHQPFRAPLIPGLDEILGLSVPGLLGVALSGAGPTVLTMATPAEAESVGRVIARVFEKHGVKATPNVVNIDIEGRVIET
jgi:homoserine kinase